MATRSAGTTSPVRIACLVPAATDIVAALGLGENLVGVSHECDHPLAAGLPVLTSASIAAAGLDADTDPAWVDAQVSAALEAGTALYRTDLALLRQLEPDVVIGQAICDVCAVPADTVAGHLPEGASLVALEATSLTGLEDDLAAVGHALGAGDAADRLVASLRSRITAAGAAAPEPAPSVLVLEWGDPPFVGGHWIPELVTRAGGTHVLGSADEPSRRATWGEIRHADPDIIIHAPCGYLLEVAVDEARRLFRPLGLDDRVWVADASRLFSRCTPVVAETVEALATIFAGGSPPGFVHL